MAKKASTLAVVPGARKAHPNAKRAMTHRKAAKAVAPVAGGIQDRAMLAALTVRRFHIGRTDQGMEQDIADANKAESQMFRVRKHLFRKDAAFKLRALEAQLRSEHHLLTLPWEDNGYRILSSAGYFLYVQKMQALIEQYKAAADELVEGYAELKADAKVRLGHRYAEADYPSAAKLRACYAASVSIRPMQCVEDFRVDLGVNVVSAVRGEMAAELDAQLKAAYRSVWERLQKVVGHAVDRLRAYSVDAQGKVSHPFRESLIGNIRDLLEIVPILNVQNDAALSDYAAKIGAEIAAYSAETLRDDTAVREKVIDSAEDILAKMAGFLA